MSNNARARLTDFIVTGGVRDAIKLALFPVSSDGYRSRFDDDLSKRGS